GGLYFDTDVEVIRPMDDIVAQGAFMGWESREGGKNASVNPGLGLGAAAAMPLYAEILARFAEMSFWGAGGVRSPYSMIPMVTELLHGKGLALTGETQTLDGALTVYSAEYFNPKDSLTGKIVLTGNTRTIHHYTMSWVSWHRRLGTKIMRLVHYASKRCH
ncbi:MAG: glycosyl transferase, partial [Alloprevotella sp.]|nr:glycosyl transferase [Alloprevotella sp.]